MGARALRAAVAILAAGLTTWGFGTAHAQPNPFAAMNALRATPPVAAPDVTFQGLDGRHARLESFRGRPVLLTFFTTW